MHSWSEKSLEQHFITSLMLCKRLSLLLINIYDSVKTNTALPSVVDIQGILLHIIINNHTVNTPASLASSSLGMPLILLCFTDEHFLFSCVWALNFTQLRILSTIPQLVACRGQGDKILSWLVSNYLLWRIENRVKRRWKQKRIVLTALINFSDRRHLDPKLFVWSVIFSLVWESKVGFSISAFTNTQMWFFTWSTNKSTVNQFLKHVCSETTAVALS